MISYNVTGRAIMNHSATHHIVNTIIYYPVVIDVYNEFTVVRFNNNNMVISYEIL